MIFKKHYKILHYCILSKNKHNYEKTKLFNMLNLQKQTYYISFTNSF